MVRAEGLPLWAFDDPPAEERDAIFAEVRGQGPDGLDRRARGGRHLRAHRRTRRLPRGARGLPGVGARRRHQRDHRVRRAAGGRDRRRAVGLRRASPSRARRSTCHPRHRRRARGAARTLRPARPTPAPGACCAAVLHAASRPRWRIPPRRRGSPRSASARRAPPCAATRSTAARPTSGRWSTSPSARWRRPWTSSRACTATPSRRSRSLPLRLLVTVGRDRDPAELGPLPANVRVERWVPQADLMPHVAAMVCHGGSGTVTMGLAGGVPMAVVPLFADQPWNAERVDALGAGIALGARPGGGDRRAARGGRPAHRRSVVPLERPAHRRRDARAAAGRRRGRRRARAARRRARRMTEPWASVMWPCASESTWLTRASPRGARRRRSSSTGG